MLLDTYAQQNLFFNMNFNEAAGAGLKAYRGDLVLTEGEVADASGRRKPPTAAVRQAVLLGDAGQMQLAAGYLDDVAKLPLFAERYAADLAPEATVLFYVGNLAAPLSVSVGPVKAGLLPLDDGMVWNELLDEVRLDKDDLKGQSAAAKVATVAAAFKGYAPRGESVDMATALGRAVAMKHGGRGPV